MQKKFYSLIEVASASVFKLGFMTVSQIIWFNIHLGHPIWIRHNLGFAVYALFASIGLGYIWRRMFNKRT